MSLGTGELVFITGGNKKLKLSIAMVIQKGSDCDLVCFSQYRNMEHIL